MKQKLHVEVFLLQPDVYRCPIPHSACWAGRPIRVKVHGKTPNFRRKISVRLSIPDCLASNGGFDGFYCVQSWRATGIAWNMDIGSALLDAINRGPIRAEDIASKTDGVPAHKTARAADRRPQPISNATGDIACKTLPCNSAQMGLLALVAARRGDRPLAACRPYRRTLPRAVRCRREWQALATA